VVGVAAAVSQGLKAKTETFEANRKTEKAQEEAKSNFNKLKEGTDKIMQIQALNTDLQGRLLESLK
jgi:hypothetical protein